MTTFGIARPLRLSVSGTVSASGDVATSSVPTWASGATLNAWTEIAGTSGAGGAAVDAFSGWALVGTKVVIACAGGHGSGHDNRVVSCDLSANSPSWTTLMAASASGTNDAAYYSDGKPCSRHTYHSIHAITGNKVLLGGVRFTYNGGQAFYNLDAFDLDTNTWDGVVPGSPGTSGSGYAAQSPSGAYTSAQDGDGNLWWIGSAAVAKYTVSTNTWSSPSITGAVTDNVRYPWAWDSARSQLFGLCWADGEGSGTGLRAMRQNGTTQAAISFNASSALTDLIADAPEYAAMGYEPTLDKFLFYEGHDTRAGRVYVITPNDTTTWDVSVLSTTGTPTATFGTKAGQNYSGVQNRFSYISFGSVAGFVMLPRASSNLYFLRTA